VRPVVLVGVPVGLLVEEAPARVGARRATASA
jgi:hypothetical protein